MCTQASGGVHGAKVYTEGSGGVRQDRVFWDAGLCECARRVSECASWSEGAGLVYEGAPGCPPNRDCYVCGCARETVPARPPPDQGFAPLTVRPKCAGAAGRDAPPGLGAAPWLLLAFSAAALRAPPALGLRAGERRQGVVGY